MKKNVTKIINGKLVWIGENSPKGLITKNESEVWNKQFKEDKENHDKGIITPDMKKRGWS